MIVNRQRSGKIRATELGLGLIVLIFIGICFGFQHHRFKAAGFRVWIYEQKLKLPPAEILKLATLGYSNVYSNYLWLESIQAFGSGWRTEGNKTEPMFQYFDTLTDIDPRFEPAYRFGNLVVGDQKGDYKLGQDILRKGSLNLPGNYAIPYLGVYNSMWMGNHPIDGKWFAIRLQRIPSAPNFMKRMLEYIEREEGHYEMAFEMNVRYYLDYHLADDNIEQEIVTRRMQDLLDRQNRAKLSEAVYKYIREKGEHPTAIEQVITPEFLPAYKGPTAVRFKQAIDKFIPSLDEMKLKKGDIVPDQILRAITESSMENIEGLPVDPFGTWYMIHTPTRLGLMDEGFTVDEKKPVGYVISAADLLPIINRKSMSFQQFVLAFYKNNDKKLPSDEEIKSFMGRDPLGGHYVYQRIAPESPDYGVYFSTAGMRISKREEPRIGLHGRGPFPMTVEPMLRDNPEDKEWGLKNGYILPDGTEVWETADQQAAREKARAAAKVAESAEKATSAKPNPAP